MNARPKVFRSGERAFLSSHVVNLNPFAERKATMNERLVKSFAPAKGRSLLTFDRVSNRSLAGAKQDDPWPPRQTEHQSSSLGPVAPGDYSPSLTRFCGTLATCFGS
jgi:hypothetical protein